MRYDYFDVDSTIAASSGKANDSIASPKLAIVAGPFATVDADYAWSHARFTEPDPAGDRIPNAVNGVVSLGLTADLPSGWFGGARLRHLGAAPLIEDNSARSNPTTVMNADVGYRFSNRWSASVHAQGPLLAANAPTKVG